MDKILSMIQSELFILIIFLYALGMFFKLYEGFKKEYTIPFILLGISVVICQLYMSVVLNMGFSADVVIVSLIQAVLIAAVAVFGNNLIKQMTVKRYEDTVKILSNPKEVK